MEIPPEIYEKYPEKHPSNTLRNPREIPWEIPEKYPQKYLRNTREIPPEIPLVRSGLVWSGLVWSGLVISFQKIYGLYGLGHVIKVKR